MVAAFFLLPDQILVSNEPLVPFPAVAGKKRCRMHGGAKGSGAPKGNKNALKHGLHTAEAKAMRQHVRELKKYLSGGAKAPQPPGKTASVQSSEKPDYSQVKAAAEESDHRGEG